MRSRRTMAVVTYSMALEFERDPELKKALIETHRAKFGLVGQTTDVRLMVKMLGLEETVRRIESRSASLEFDGQFLRWMENGMSCRAWIAASGKIKFHEKRYQYLAGMGPIPEGHYIARQQELQRWEDYSLFSRRACFLRALRMTRFTGSWPGCTRAWGDRRIWLRPSVGTVTLGRDNFSIHGGTVLGSAGCIDLTSGMPDFVDSFIKYGKDMDLNVRY